MKAKAKQEKENKAPDANADTEMRETDELEELAKKEVESKKQKTDTAFYDKVYNYLQNQIVVVGSRGL